MRYAAERMKRFREDQFRAQRAVMPDQAFEFREGLNITGEGPFPSINPGLPDTGLPNPTARIFKEARERSAQVSVPTRIGNLG